MDRYFSAEIYGDQFAMFSTMHMFTLAAIFLMNILLGIWFKYSKDKKFLDNFRILLACLMLFNELIYEVWSVLSGDWTWDHSLPIQLCEAATFLSIYMLMRNSYFAFEIVYFLGLGGGIQALLTPDLIYPFPHIKFFTFFFSHFALITAIVFMIVVKGFKPTFKSIKKTFFVTNLYMVAISVINILTDGNYMFLCSKPENGSILDFLGPWPWYVLSLQIVGLIICLICYLPFAVKLYTNRGNI